ncbi:Snn1p [Maudiozyma exigua]|uniref:Snn1p n=1 Tax=Maudiozyma exigua TaxID=34358 RepID=A0A9P6W243_MAUEX|nr:Snn1p [Kazachstania exigua]
MSSSRDGVHPIELSVFSLLSTDLDGINKAVTELRESQTILILKLRKIRESLKDEYSLLYEAEDINKANLKLELLKKRILVLEQRYKKLMLDIETQR